MRTSKAMTLACNCFIAIFITTFSLSAKADYYFAPGPCCTQTVHHVHHHYYHKTKAHKPKAKKRHYRSRNHYKIEKYYACQSPCCYNPCCNNIVMRSWPYEREYRVPQSRCSREYIDYDRSTADDYPPY